MTPSPSRTPSSKHSRLWGDILEQNHSTVIYYCQTLCNAHHCMCYTFMTHAIGFFMPASPRIHEQCSCYDVAAALMSLICRNFSVPLWNHCHIWSSSLNEMSLCYIRLKLKDEIEVSLVDLQINLKNIPFFLPCHPTP